MRPHPPLRFVRHRRMVRAAMLTGVLIVAALIHFLGGY